MSNLQFAFAQLWSQKEYDGITKIVFVEATDLLLCNGKGCTHAIFHMLLNNNNNIFE